MSCQEHSKKSDKDPPLMCSASRVETDKNNQPLLRTTQRTEWKVVVGGSTFSIGGQRSPLRCHLKPNSEWHVLTMKAWAWGRAGENTPRIEHSQAKAEGRQVGQVWQLPGSERGQGQKEQNGKQEALERNRWRHWAPQVLIKWQPLLPLGPAISSKPGPSLIVFCLSFSWQVQNMKYKDRRLKTMNEILNGIKVKKKKSQAEEILWVQRQSKGLTQLLSVTWLLIPLPTRFCFLFYPCPFQILLNLDFYLFTLNDLPLHFTVEIL